MLKKGTSKNVTLKNIKIKQKFLKQINKLTQAWNNKNIKTNEMTRVTKNVYLNVHTCMCQYKHSVKLYLIHCLIQFFCCE